MSKGLCVYAFLVLEAHLHNTKAIPLSKCLSLVDESISQFPTKAPLFITWDKDDNLRGCIGTFSSQPIELGVKRFSLTASIEDPRFPPISLKELDKLSCSVTLLDKFTAINDPLAWVVGEHGLRLSFTYGGQHFSGTFLPSVAEEQNWDKLTTLWYLLRKADFEGVSKTATVDFYNKGLQEGWLKLDTYEGLKYTLYYEDYELLKNKLT